MRLTTPNSGIPASTSNPSCVCNSFLFAALPVALVGFISAIYQGNVAGAGMNIASKQPGEVGKAIILAAMVETYAVIALLTTILLVNGINFA